MRTISSALDAIHSAAVEDDLDSSHGGDEFIEEDEFEDEEFDDEDDEDFDDDEDDDDNGWDDGEIPEDLGVEEES